MKIHMMGIGGTGMASLAGMLQAQGHEVQGSDQGVYPPMSGVLESMGIPVHCPYKVENLTPAPDLVIIGNVISRGNPEAEAVLAQGLDYESMAAAIRRFFLPEKTSLVVAGTHGKTTTTSLLAWVLESAGKDPGFFVGGKPKNFPQNFQLGSGQYFVLEGDEYDTAFFDKGPKFLHYNPQDVLLTSVEFDHADIYDDLEQILISFRKLLKIIPADGSLVANLDFPEVCKLLPDFSGKVLTYSMEDEFRQEADYFAEVVASSPQCKFRVHGPKGMQEVTWDQVGRYNVSNALAVWALVENLGLSAEEIIKGLQSFQGVARRQDVLATVNEIAVIDDFAHHPTAVRETILGMREKYPQQTLWAIFEPRSNTSKRDIFQQAYAEAFDQADRVIIADVFMPEKVKIGKILQTAQLVQDINQRNGSKAQRLSSTEEMIELLMDEAQVGDVILLMSNGDFDGLGPKLVKALAGAGEDGLSA